LQKECALNFVQFFSGPICKYIYTYIYLSKSDNIALSTGEQTKDTQAEETGGEAEWHWRLYKFSNRDKPAQLWWESERKALGN